MAFIIWFFGWICGVFSVLLTLLISSNKQYKCSVYKNGFVRKGNKSWWLFGEHPFWNGERVDGNYYLDKIKNEKGDLITVAKYKTNK